MPVGSQSVRIEVERSHLTLDEEEELLNGCGPNSIEWIPELIFHDC